MRTDGLTW